MTPKHMRVSLWCALNALRFIKDLGRSGHASTATWMKTRRKEIEFTGASGMLKADIYDPVNARSAPMIISPGTTPKGRRDPVFIAFVSTFVRSGYQVFVPENAELREQQLHEKDATVIADAISHFQALRESDQKSVSFQPVAVVAISYMVGPAILSLIRPDIQARVGLLLGIGGYFDLENVLAFATTGYYRNNGEWVKGEANSYVKWVLAMTATAAYAADLNSRKRPPSHRSPKLDTDTAIEKISGILQIDSVTVTKLLEDRNPEEMADRFSRIPETMQVLLRNKNPEKFADLMKALPAEIKNKLRSLDLKRRDLSIIDVRAILIHGQTDQVMPCHESSRLAQAWRRGGVNTFILEGLGHVDQGKYTLSDLIKLFRIGYAIATFRNQDKNHG